MYEYFYNKNLRKLVVAFGSLFSNVQVEHANPDGGNPLQIRVPISYAPQEKFIQRWLQPSSIDDTTRIEKTLPVMSYIINNIIPDPSRRRNKFTYTKAYDSTGGQCENTGNQVFQEVPVNVAFTLYIYTRHIDDTLQIMEQIIPYFNPEHLIKLSMNEVNQDVQIPIIMGNNSVSERYDGELSSRRINVSSISFTAKSYIFGIIKPLVTIDDTNTVAGITG
jgi:hypothetical protein